MDIHDTPCSLNSAANHALQRPSLSDVLKNSTSLERALTRMCETREFEHPTNGSNQKLYSFNLQKCMAHFSEKFERIKRHLAQSYVRENRGYIQQLNESQNQRRAIIKQEPKNLNDARIKKEMKSEVVKAEHAGLEIDVSKYEEQFEVMAMGVVADELP